MSWIERDLACLPRILNVFPANFVRKLLNGRPVEFNQLATVRTAFEESTARRQEQLLQPPPQVKNWLDETEFDEFRKFIRTRRVINDRELFERLSDLTDGKMD
jgi:hypothetical protein